MAIVAVGYYPNTFHRFYRAWSGIKSRCKGNIVKSNKYYKDKGIVYCDRWEYFEQFMVDMYPEYLLKNGDSRKLQIDRINSSGNYEPDNCRWVTSLEQQNNKSNIIKLLNPKTGEIKSLYNWAKYYKISSSNIYRKRQKEQGNFTFRVSPELSLIPYYENDDIKQCLTWGFGIRYNHGISKGGVMMQNKSKLYEAQVNIPVTKEEKQKLSDVSWANRISVAEFCRKLFSEAIKKEWKEEYRGKQT